VIHKIWAVIHQAGLLSLLLLGVSAGAHAQTAGLGNWPSQKPIRLIAVFPPGGSVDQVARILAQELQTQLKQNVIVENIGGASGVIGTSAMTRSDPDGYTFAVVFDTHGVNPILKDKMPYDTIKDIAPVTLIGTSPMVLVASKNSGITSFKQLTEQSKTGKPFSYGSIGIGSLGHLSMARLAKQAGSGSSGRPQHSRTTASICQTCQKSGGLTKV
jgi:tripartite-type tricarboxylate transporter receptor subunit TctC